MKFNLPASIVLVLAVAAATAIPATVKAESNQSPNSPEAKEAKVTPAQDSKVGPQTKGCWFIPGYGLRCV
jgi:hypothetical protein